MPRHPPERTPAQQKAHGRVEALRIGDVATVRSWAAKWSVHLFGDDAFLLWTIHDARVSERAVPQALRMESREWLRTHSRPEE